MNAYQGTGDDSVPTWCSLITVTYNSRRAIDEFWGKNQKPPAGIEWIVVDNASSDGSAEAAEAAGATRVVRLLENRGFSFSNNAGLEVAAGEFIGFVNPDVRVDYGDLPLLRAVASDRHSIVAPQLLNSDGSLQPNGRGFPFLLDKVRNRLSSGDRLEGRYLLFSDSDEPRAVVWLMGAVIFGERADIDKFGAWDPHFFLYYEDKDFCLRAWRADVPVALVPTARWTHGWARETTSISANPWKREFASMFKFYRRYPEFLVPKAVAFRKHADIVHDVYGTSL